MRAVNVVDATAVVIAARSIPPTMGHTGERLSKKVKNFDEQNIKLNNQLFKSFSKL